MPHAASATFLPDFIANACALCAHAFPMVHRLKRGTSLFSAALTILLPPRNKRQVETLKELRDRTLEGRVADGAIYFDPTASK